MSGPAALREIYSDIWAGHTVPNSLYGGKKITGVASQWTQPRVPADSHYHCTKTSCMGPDASAWAGFDGSGPGLIQAGCDSLSAARPAYFCWWEDYPKPTHEVPLTIKPGQGAYVSIQYLGNHKTSFFIENTTTMKHWKHTEPTPDVGQTNAIFMVERLMNTGRTGYYLPDFGSVTFLANAFFQGSRANELTSGKNFPWAMVDGCSSKDKALATPGNIVHIDQFTVTWKASRPFSDKACK